MTVASERKNLLETTATMLQGNSAERAARLVHCVDSIGREIMFEISRQWHCPQQLYREASLDLQRAADAIMHVQRSAGMTTDQRIDALITYVNTVTRSYDLGSFGIRTSLRSADAA
jgi:hypothetical protein